MGHSYVEYKRSYFFFKDIDLFFLMGALCHLHRQELEKNSQLHCLNELMDWWKTFESHPGSGCFDLRLDRYLQNNKQRELLFSLTEKLEFLLAESGELLPVSLLNSMQLPDAPLYQTPVKRAHFLQVIDKLQDILRPVQYRE